MPPPSYQTIINIANIFYIAGIYLTYIRLLYYLNFLY